MEEYINFFNNDLIKNLIGLLISLLTAFITAKITLKNTKKSLTTQHFKENAVEVQVILLNFWITLFIENFNISKAYQIAFKDSKLKSNLNSDTDILKYVSELSYVYCSASTITNLSAYQQYVYKNNSLNNSNKKKKSNLKMYCPMALISRIIVSLKFDFTGEKIDAIDILKIKINDLNYKHIIIFRIVYLYYSLTKRVT